MIEGRTLVKKVNLFIIVICCILLITGCGKINIKPDDTASDKSNLVSLRDNIKENDSMLAVGFLGYIDSQNDESTIREYIANNLLTETYSFLRDLSPVALEGSELYAFVVADDNISITIYASQCSEEGYYVDNKDEPLYIGKAGENIILRCNINEIFSNVLISVTDGTNVLEFHPLISQENGHIVQENGCYDFSIYQSIENGSIETAELILSEKEEIQEAIKNGMKLLYTEETINIDGNKCLLFTLGTDNEGHFVREKYYAVADEVIYAYYPETDKWIEI